MAKTQEELKALKEEYEALSNKLKELTDEELNEVTGGWNILEEKEGIHLNDKGNYDIYFGPVSEGEN